jgi:hypothetical protein
MKKNYHILNEVIAPPFPAGKKKFMTNYSQDSKCQIRLSKMEAPEVQVLIYLLLFCSVIVG